MKRLREDQKRFVVQLLAQYRTPAVVAREFRTVYGEEIEPKRVFDYDPSKRANEGRISEQLRELFGRTREEYLETAVQGIGVAQQPYRLERLHRMSELAEAKGNLQLAASLLEQAAKEVGGHYTRASTDTQAVEFTLRLGALPGLESTSPALSEARQIGV